MAMNYKLSVRLMTFNHERYIKDAMDGIMAQKTDFPFEVVVGDDFSTDNTLSIIKTYQNTNNINIKILQRKKGDDYWQHRQKYGRLYNFIDILNHCTGKYIALLDGDDFWTNENKLQKQVDFLENNPDYSICFHPVIVDYGKKKEISDLVPMKDATYTITDLASKNLIHSCSVVFRNNLEKGLPDWLASSPVGDYVLHLLNARWGKLKFLATPMATYRRHLGSVWTPLSPEQKHVRIIDMFDHLLTESFDPGVKERLGQQRRNMITEYLSVLMVNQKWDKLKTEIQKYCKDDAMLAEFWLREKFPDYIKNIMESRTFRFTKRMQQTKNSLKNICYKFYLLVTLRAFRS